LPFGADSKVSLAMASDLVVVLIVVGVVAAAVLFALCWPPVESNGDERGLPAQLRGARLVHAEETFRSVPRGLIARLDRAYELSGEIVLVEFKTRHARAAYKADIIELSVQRVALQDERDVRVSKVAWVVTEDSATGRRTSHRVELLEAAEVDVLRARYLTVEAGNAHDARGARSVKQCVQCGHRLVCESRRG